MVRWAFCNGLGPGRILIMGQCLQSLEPNVGVVCTFGYLDEYMEQIMQESTIYMSGFQGSGLRVVHNTCLEGPSTQE